jgi:hypothetical protein
MTMVFIVSVVSISIVPPLSVPGPISAVFFFSSFFLLGVTYGREARVPMYGMVWYHTCTSTS